MRKTTKSFSVWCKFSPSDTDFLIQIQNKVKKKLRSPDFSLHMTLATSSNKLTALKFQKIKELCIKHPPFTVKPLKYGYKNIYFESFFISIENSKKLEFLRNEIFTIENTSFTKNFSPHISLAYGNYKDQIKKDLTFNLPRLTDQITIDKLCIVDTSKGINLWNISDCFQLNTELLY